MALDKLPYFLCVYVLSARERLPFEPELNGKTLQMPGQFSLWQRLVPKGWGRLLCASSFHLPDDWT